MRGGNVTAMSKRFLCLHGHFYQPPREDPFTGQVPAEPGAAPYANFNEKITAECYRPNAEAGNFELISFNLGPTLAAWIEQHAPDVYTRIIEADKQHTRQNGYGNALAQVYNHTILPLATERDKRTQVAWGKADFEHRFGRVPEGMWLAETAVDLPSLETLADAGLQYTVLAPWQAAEAIDVTEPYLVRLPSGRAMTVFFYNAPLSGGVSFESDMTRNADLFATSYLPHHLNHEKEQRGEAQLITVATDGELYGHHKPWRDKFLTHLVRKGASAFGFEVCSLSAYFHQFPATREVRLHTPSSWSCHHGISRWGEGCGCTEGDARWKPALRRALSRLGERGDVLFEQGLAKTIEDPWAARNDYLALRQGWLTPEAFWEQHGKKGHMPWPLPAHKGHAPKDERALKRTMLLLEGQFYQQWMYTSCGFFFEDLDRLEPRNDIAFARRAISLYWQAAQVDLQTDFLADLAEAKSWRTGLTGADLYRQLPAVSNDLLPTSAEAAAPRAESAA
jgi:alpha-amylase/alpha-mannosidase (GH57 family)